MEKIMKSKPKSFFKIVPYSSELYNNLNMPLPYYDDRTVEVISITPIGNNTSGTLLLCYELVFKS